jgi:hypothetical protein
VLRECRRKSSSTKSPCLFPFPFLLNGTFAFIFACGNGKSICEGGLGFFGSGGGGFPGVFETDFGGSFAAVDAEEDALGGWWGSC